MRPESKVLFHIIQTFLQHLTSHFETCLKVFYGRSHLSIHTLAGHQQIKYRLRLTFSLIKKSQTLNVLFPILLMFFLNRFTLMRFRNPDIHPPALCVSHTAHQLSQMKWWASMGLIVQR